MRNDIASNHSGWIWCLGTIATVAFVLLGSWYPFELLPGQFATAWQHWLSSVAVTPSKSDVAINLMLGVPLGFFCTLMLVCPEVDVAPKVSRSGLRWLISVMLTLALLALCAITAELGQHWFGNRVPSAYDTLAQVVGGCVGIVFAYIGGKWIAARVQDLIGGYGETPIHALLDLYLASYSAWMLTPFIPCVSPSELKHKWKSGMIELSLFAEWRADLWQALYTTFVTSCSAVPIGFAIARLLVPRAGWQVATLGSAAFVVGLEVLQIVIETRSAQAADAFWATVGALVGVVVYYYVAHRSVNTSEAYRLQYGVIWNAMAFLAIVGYVGVALAPFDWIDSEAELYQRVRQLRSELGSGMLAGNDMMNASNLFRTLLMSSVLGALLGCTSVGRRDSGKWIGMAALVFLLTGICGVTELLQILSDRHSPSVLASAVRVVGGWLGLAISVNIVRHAAHTALNSELRA